MLFLNSNFISLPACCWRFWMESYFLLCLLLLCLDATCLVKVKIRGRRKHSSYFELSTRKQEECVIFSLFFQECWKMAPSTRIVSHISCFGLCCVFSSPGWIFLKKIHNKFGNYNSSVPYEVAFSDPGKYKMLIVSLTDWLIYLTIKLWRTNGKLRGSCSGIWEMIGRIWRK